MLAFLRLEKRPHFNYACIITRCFLSVTQSSAGQHLAPSEKELISIWPSFTGRIGSVPVQRTQCTIAISLFYCFFNLHPFLVRKNSLTTVHSWARMTSRGRSTASWRATRFTTWEESQTSGGKLRMKRSASPIHSSTIFARAEQGLCTTKVWGRETTSTDGHSTRTQEWRTGQLYQITKDGKHQHQLICIGGQIE